MKKNMLAKTEDVQDMRAISSTTTHISPTRGRGCSLTYSPGCDQSLTQMVDTMNESDSHQDLR